MKSIFLETIAGKNSKRPPVWFMRQAGRVLPSYVELRKNYSFSHMMNDPDLAAKVSLLPVHDLGVDAIILFSDILVIPYAMGMDLEFTDKGPKFNKPLKDLPDALSVLDPNPDRLQYIYKTIDKIIEIRPKNTPLIGFAGAPLTVLCYMIEGLSSKSGFNDTVSFIYRNKKITEKLTEIITDLTIEYAEQQIAHGIDTFQLFETHGGVIPFEIYSQMFFPAIKKIYGAVRDKGIPFIYFPKDIGAGLKYITPDLCDFVSIDWQTPISEARNMVHPEVGLQGNLDPRLLFTDKAVIEQELIKFVDFGSRNYKWIFNLGHGFIPGSNFENAKYIVDWVKSVNWNRNE